MIDKHNIRMIYIYEEDYQKIFKDLKLRLCNEEGIRYNNSDVIHYLLILELTKVGAKR